MEADPIHLELRVVALYLNQIETLEPWGPVDVRGHAMLGWPMEEEAKLEFTITVNWRRETATIATTQLGMLDRGACRSARCGVCTSRTPSQFSGGYKRLWSANNCSATAKLYGRVLAVIIVAI